MSATRATLAPGRWHFQHGPIDLVIGADGDPEAVGAALDSAWSRFGQVLPELVAELAGLRAPVARACALRGTIARRMWQACEPFARTQFVTPMAAVAGSVAQEIVACFERRGVSRAWVNNGGDIALHLAPGQTLRVAVCSDPRLRDARAIAADSTIVAATDPVRGIATSGWRGRSLSLGIADAVTVLASSAARADAAATIVANAVDVDHPAIRRLPASRVRDDSDLEHRAVTVEVGRLPEASVELALGNGARCASALVERGLIVEAMLSLQGRSRIVTPDSPRPRARQFKQPALQS